MFGIHAISAYLLAIGLLTLLVAILVWQTHRSGKTIIVWLAAGVVGILLGSAGSYGLMRVRGYEVTKAPTAVTAVVPVGGEAGEAAEATGGPGGGMGSGMGSGGGGGMGGGMFGGPRPPRPKRDLTTLVRELALLTGDVAVTLSDEQAKSLCACLADVESADTMSDDDAQAKHDEILALLDDDQKSRLDAISLPRGRPGGSGGSGRGGPGGSGGPGGPGGEQDPDANPFQQEASSQALTTLRDRFAPEDQPGETPPAKE